MMEPIKADSLDEFSEKLQDQSIMLAAICSYYIREWRESRRKKREFDFRREPARRYANLRSDELRASSYLRGILTALRECGALDWGTEARLAEILIDVEKA